MRNTYELIPAGARSGRTVLGWRVATRAAQVEATRRDAPVAVWQWEDGLRTLRVTITPEGRWVRHLALHRRPKGLGLLQERDDAQKHRRS